MLGILKRPAALQDIEECFVHIAGDNLEVGLAFLYAVDHNLERLTEFPSLGRARNFRSEELGDVRMWRVEGYDKYLIFYTVGGGSIEIIRVLHASRDIDDLFS